MIAQPRKSMLPKAAVVEAVEADQASHDPEMLLLVEAVGDGQWVDPQV